MKIIDLLKKGHSRALREKIVAIVGDSPARFSELVRIYLAGPYRITQRASWPLSYCVQKHPSLVKPHLRLLLKYLDKPETHVAVRRNTIRLLQFIDIPPALQGRVSAICFAFITDQKQPIAVRAFSITVLAKIGAEHPEIRNELHMLLQDRLDYESPAFRSRARRVLGSRLKL